MWSLLPMVGHWCVLMESPGRSQHFIRCRRRRFLRCRLHGRPSGWAPVWLGARLAGFVMFVTSLPPTSPVFGVPRWDDPVWVHREVVRLFGRFDPSHPRLLFRAGHGRFDRLLIQSPQVPALSVGGAPISGMVVKDLDPLLGALTDGLSVRIRAKLNAVSNSTGASGRHVGPRPIRKQDLEPWAAAKIPGLAVSRLLSLHHQVEVTSRTPLHVVTVDGVGVISDATAFRSGVVHGVGKAKAFDCGMVSVALA